MHRGALLMAIALLAVGLTGCIGGDDSDEPLQKERADVTADLGGVEGVVTDDAVQPVEGANVTLQELDRTTQTASDGSYAFSKIEPGAYTVVFRSDGFITAQETVTVQAGQAAILDVILTHAASQQAFMQQQELAGFIECGLGWETDPNPLPGATSNAVAICAVPQGLPGGENSTNDRFSHLFELEAPLDTMVYEISIPGDGGPAGSTVLSLDMWIEGFVFEERANVFDNVDAQDGHLIRVEQGDWDQISQNFTETCAGSNGTEADDTFCGYNFRDRGWPLVVRAFADGSCIDAPASACAPIQQDFTHFISAFYNQPAPEGFSVLEGSQA